MPVYFFADHALNAEYVSIEGTEPERAIFAAIAAGPSRDDLRSFVPEETALEGVGETQEKLKLTLSEEFWDLPVGERYAAAAQVTFTMAVLEEGKEIFLLDEVVPGPIVDGNGEELPQPLSREDFADVRPWVEVQQPAAGTILSEAPFPVVAEVRGRAVAQLVGVSGGGFNIRLKKGSAVLRPPTRIDGGDGPIETFVVITATEDGESYVTRIPVTLQP